MDIAKYNDVESLAAGAFERFKQCLESSSVQGRIVIALSGGSSVAALYGQIKERAGEVAADLWQKVVFCFADERLVPLDSADSNYKAACDQFLTQLLADGFITEEAILKVAVDHHQPHREYTEQIGGRVDIALLGVGPDSHTCSLFPNHSSVADDSPECILVTDSPKPPPRRISLSKKMVVDSKNAFVFFIGEGKRQAYTNFCSSEVSESEAPIKIAQSCERCFVFTDL